MDGAQAAFCGACGLAQLRVSPDAIIPAEGEEHAAKHTHHARPLVDWSAALKIVSAVAAAGALLPALIPGAVTSGTAGGFSLLSLPLLTLAVVSLYHFNRPRRTITPAIGGRLGATVGLMTGAWIALITGVVGFVLRYHYHSDTMDNVMRESFDAMMVRMESAGPQPAEVMGLIQSPEFRAGSLIAGHAISLLVMVAGGTLCGWIAGALLKSRRQRMVP